jgi:DNA-3-methyladenine glycosylase II
MMLTCTFDLPENYRPHDILAFHKRDPSMLSERVDGDTLQKGLVFGQSLGCLTIRFDTAVAHAELVVDGRLPEGGQVALESMVQRMLGLTQRIERFEQAHRSHPQLGLLIAKNPGLRVPVVATPFEALTWAGFGWLDGSLHGDVAVRRGLQSLLSSSEKITEDSAKRWLAAFSPWQALVAAHLWAFGTKNDY